MTDLSTPTCADDTTQSATEPTDLAVAIRVAQLMLAQADERDPADPFATQRSLGGVTEALRIILRAVGAEPATPAAPTPRCPAAHHDDPTPCSGPTTVTVVDARNAGADGCQHHAARLLASLDGGRVYALPDATPGTAIRVFKAADGIRPFPWLTDAPRTEPSQLSHTENRGGGQ